MTIFGKKARAAIRKLKTSTGRLVKILISRIKILASDCHV